MRSSLVIFCGLFFSLNVLISSSPLPSLRCGMPGDHGAQRMPPLTASRKSRKKKRKNKNKKPPPFMDKHSFPLYVIPVVFHILQDDTGEQGDVPLASLERTIEIANSVFQAKSLTHPVKYTPQGMSKLVLGSPNFWF
jgi:hypothetical protein